MSNIQVSTLGRLVVRRGERDLAQLPAQRLRCALLVYLAVERRATREQILSLLWPDREPERARHALSQTLYELRNTLGDDWVESRGDVMCVGDSVISDVAELEAAIEAGAWRRAVMLYRGRFLDGIYLVDTREFEGWVDRLQARLGRLFRQALREAVGELRAAGDLDEALRLARRGVEMDPLDDEAQHQLVLLLAETGQRTSALKQYERYEELLRAELEVEPLEETVQLARRIREGELDLGAASLLREPETREGEISDPDPVEADAPGTSSDDEAQTDSADSEGVEAPYQQGAPAWELIPAGGRGAFFGQRTKGGRDARSVSLLGRSTFVTVGVGVFVLVLVGFLWLGRSTSDASTDSTSVPSLPPSRIAVLYFDDHSADRSLGGLADGITETLIHALAQVPGLDVVPKNGSKLFRNRTEVPWDSVVSVLRAGTIVEGSVDRSGDTARVTVQLIDAATEGYVESLVLHLPAENRFALRDSVGARVGSLVQDRVGLEVRLDELRSGTDVEEALESVQAAEHERNNAEALEDEGALPEAEAALERADSLLSRAAELDDGWIQPPVLRGWTALDRALLEESRTLQPGGEDSEMRPHLDRARMQARVALGIDPEDPQALELAGVAGFRAWEAGLPADSAGVILARAESDLRAAIRGDPGLARAHRELSSLLWRTGRFEEALIHAEEALDEDRFLENAADLLVRLGQTHLDLRKPAEAARWFAEGHRRFPEDQRFVGGELAVLALSDLHAPNGERAWELAREMERLSPPQLRATNAAYGRLQVAAVLARADQTDSALAVMRRVEEEGLMEAGGPGALYLQSFVWLLMGDRDSAITNLRRFREAVPAWRAYLEEDWLWDPIRDDPGFQELLEP